MSRRIGVGANVELDEKAKLKMENRELAKEVEALKKKIQALNGEKKRIIE